MATCADLTGAKYPAEFKGNKVEPLQGVSREPPQYLRSDNGSEFIAKAVQGWLAENQIKTIYIDPGSPWQNGFVESFHGRFRDECLNREQLWTLTEARVVIEDFRHRYNHLRPHSKLGYQSPVRFAQQLHPNLSSTGAGQNHNPKLNQQTSPSD